MEPLVVVAVAGVALGGLAQSVTGLGFALVAAPALIAVLGPRQGVGVVVLLGTLASVLPLMGHWRRVRVRDTATLLVPTLLATPVVAALLRGMDTATVAVGAGVAVLIGVVALWRGFTWDRLVSVPGAVGTGITSAALNVIGGVGGPPVGLYAANAGWDPPESRASLQAFFLVQGIATVAVVGLTWPDAWMVGALIVGTVAGMVAIPCTRKNA
ncbi:MAG TPA: TSUP family transporter, partial [Candidatus Limnocylindrales bacterium]|nr:TSUP family transporter [Candidatus Limnocylindrales bacterium]